MLDHPIGKEVEPSLVSMYVHELYNLALSITQKCQSIFELTPPVPTRPDRYIAVRPDVHALINGVLIDCANVRKLLLTPSARDSRETRRQYDFRRYRAAMLQSVVEGVELTELLNSKVRNTLEHFDEYMDQAVLELSDAKRRSAPWAAFNMIVSGRDVFQPAIFPIRVYVAEERVFQNMRWAIDIGRVSREASTLLALLKKHPTLNDKDGIGGMLITFRGAQPDV